MQNLFGMHLTSVLFVFADKPDSPTKPIIGSSQVSAREVTISWTPRGDGYGPLRNYTVRYKAQGGSWETVEDVVKPDVTSYTVTR